ncbi:MAG: lysozyme inhibitor LprI family protein [Marinifilaceae bacterium]
MKALKLVFGILFLSKIILAQQYPIVKGSTMDYLTGIFKIDEYPTDKVYSYTVGKNYKSVCFEKTVTDTLYVTIVYEGFQNSYSSFSDFLDKNPERKFYLDSLKLTGEYFTCFLESDLNKSDNRTKFLSVQYYDERDEYYVTGRNMDIYYHKKHEPPYNLSVFQQGVWRDIITLSRRDVRDYISEFLEIDIRVVRKANVPLYKEKGDKVVASLNALDIVNVMGVADKDGYVKVEYFIDTMAVDTAYIRSNELETPIKKIEASFSCKRARSAVELLICSDNYLATLDKILSAKYWQAKNYKGEELFKSQIAWIKDRENKVKSKPDYEQREILERLIKERIDFLRNWGQKEAQEEYWKYVENLWGD